VAGGREPGRAQPTEGGAGASATHYSLRGEAPALSHAAIAAAFAVVALRRKGHFAAAFLTAFIPAAFAVTGNLALAIGTWVGGFDVLYACQDLDFDRAQGLRSVPVRFGVPASLAISRTMHVVTVVSLLALPLVTPLPRAYVGGVLLVAGLLAYEQSLVSADDLSQVKRAFDLNGYVGILYFIVLAGSVYGG